MGGFHGGHSSGGGGGFHGGHSSHSHSSHSSHSYRSSSYRSTRIYHTSGGGVYIGGSRGRRTSSLVKYLIFGIMFIMIGIISFIAFFDVAVKATITKASIVGPENDKYEIYDFDYYYNNKQYSGYGDDDLTSSGELSINVGETYTLYVNPIAPSNYKFDSDAPIGLMMLLIFVSGGIALIVIGIVNYTKIQKELKKVGDANKDGVVDERDLEYADKVASGQAEGAYEGTKAAEAENAYQKNKIHRRCKFCDSIVSDDASFCPNCGSNLRD